jgi:hypothetical protein
MIIGKAGCRANRVSLWVVVGGCLFGAVLVAPVQALADNRAEPPPPEFDSGPYTARPTFTFNPDRDCRILNGDPGPQVRINGCYVPMTDEMILPRDCDETRGKIGETCRALIRHEEGQARGWRH